MTTPFSYSKSYILDKSHYSETFDESVIVDTSKTVYFKSGVLAIFGLTILLFTNVNPYAAWFIVALGALEALSIRFKKPWWLARQMMSKAANAEMTLTINEKKITSKSFYVNHVILWSEVRKLEPTTQGWLVIHSLGRNYISNRCLSDEATAFLQQPAEQIAQ